MSNIKEIKALKKALAAAMKGDDKPKKRGRPPKTATITPIASAKKRGRPPGNVSKRAPQAIAASKIKKFKIPSGATLTIHFA